MPDDDADILRASLADPERFGELFERHHAAVWAYLARRAGAHRADELGGDVFVKAFRARGSYEPTLGSVRAWLYGIAGNVLRTRLRSDARAVRAFQRAGRRETAPPSGFDEVDDAAAARDRLARVIGALARLSAADREIVTLFAWERLSYEDIAAVLGVPVGTVRSRLARARGRLAELLGPSGEVTGELTPSREDQ